MSGQPSSLDGFQPSDEHLAELHRELHRLAGVHLRRESSRPLQTTELLHEAWLRLHGVPALMERDRPYLYAVASKVIRDVLVDHARQRSQIKRGHGWRRIELDSADGARADSGSASVDLLDLDDAMIELERVHPRRCRIIEWRFFGNLRMEDIARLLDISVRTASDECNAARDWLHRWLTRGQPLDSR